MDLYPRAEGRGGGQGGGKAEYPERTSDGQPENQYHMLQEAKIDRSFRELNPRPPTLLLRLFGQNEPVLTN